MGSHVPQAPSTRGGDETPISSPLRRFVVKLSAPASVIALALAAVLALGWFVTQTVLGQAIDNRAYSSVGASGRAWALIVDPLAYISIASVALATCALVLMACVRGRADLAVGACVIIAGSNVTTQILKRVITYHPATDLPSFPSGHTTVAASLCVAGLFVAPTALRRTLLPLGAFLTTFVGAGTLVGHWHKPSDVIGAFGVVALWAGLAIALSQLWGRGRRQRPVVEEVVSAALSPLLGAAASGLLFLAAGVRPSERSGQLPIAVAALLAIGLACILMMALVDMAIAFHVPVDDVTAPEVNRRVAVFVGATALLGGLAVLRVTGAGKKLEHLGQNSLGGGGYGIQGSAKAVSLMPYFTVLVFAAVVAMFLASFTAKRVAWRAPALMAGSLLVLTNVGVIAIKSILGSTQIGAHATLPSGHAALGLTSAAAIVLCYPAHSLRPWAYAISGWLASCGMLGVVTGRMHTPGDSLASAALLVASASVIGWVVRAITPVRTADLAERTRLGRDDVWAVCAGAAAWMLTCVLLGIDLISASPLWKAVGAVVLLLLPAVGAASVLLVVRVASPVSSHDD